jgi:hypothetical protein
MMRGVHCLINRHSYWKSSRLTHSALGWVWKWVQALAVALVSASVLEWVKESVLELHTRGEDGCVRIL